MRLRNNPNAEENLKNSEYLVQNFPFKIQKNTIIELGMGKGEMITQLALENPEKNYLGIEKYATVAEKAMKKAKKMNLNNFKILCEDISKIPSLLDGKVKTIWLTFSDPWPKNKHEKRRLTHINFFNIYKLFLEKNGVIKFKTDNDKLFEWTIEHLTENNINLDNITRDFHSHKCSKNNVMTGYEKKWSDKGKKINYLEARF